MNRVEVPHESGAYRWYYADVTAGDMTAVFIFMVGSIFSARYSASLKKGGLPREHAAVNFALYEKGNRWQWVLSEYQAVSVEDAGRTLRIGASHVTYDDAGSLSMVIRDKTTPGGKPTEARLQFTRETPVGEEVRLVEGLEHYWRPIAPRGTATVELPVAGISFEGRGYHDGNHGRPPLGADLRGWEWCRTHHPDRTSIAYRPWVDGPSISVEADAKRVQIERTPTTAIATRRSGWGLRVPQSLGIGERPAMLESSPFYARLESADANAHAMGEVADFGRFHSPAVRWMANFRTRTGDAA